MPGLFSRLKGKDSKSKKKNAGNDLPTFSKPTWDDAWTRKSVDPEEIHELLHFCTEELKARGTIDPRSYMYMAVSRTASTPFQS